MLNRRKVSLNLLFGILGQIIVMFVSLLVPKLIIESYGSEMNGFISTIKNIFVYVGLLEAGIGIATIQSLYKVINDNTQINRIMAATAKQYNKVGIYYIVVIAILAITYPIIVTTDISAITIGIIICLYGGGNALRFRLQAKYLLLLKAEGKYYVISNVNTVICILTNLSKVILLSLKVNIIGIYFISFLLEFGQAYYYINYIKRNYKWIDLNVEPDYKAISQSKSVFVHQISSLIFNNTDVFVLTAFCGLKVVSVYSLYAQIFSYVNIFLGIIVNSIVFVLGQEFNNNREKYISIHDTFELYYISLVSVVFIVVSMSIEPFLKIYTHNTEDINYIIPGLGYLFMAIQLLMCGRAASDNVISFANHFEKTKSKAMIESIINISVSLIAVKIWGIYGVLIGTIVALLYRTNDMVIYANHRILKRSAVKTYKKWICNMVLVFICCKWGNVFSSQCETYLSILLNAIRLFIIFGSIFMTVNLILFKKERELLILYINNRILGYKNKLYFEK